MSGTLKKNPDSIAFNFLFHTACEKQIAVTIPRKKTQLSCVHPYIVSQNFHFLFFKDNSVKIGRF